jgi:hypothetical protein
MISAWKIFLSKPTQAVKWPKAICDCSMNTFLEKILTREPLVDSSAGHRDSETMKLALPSKYAYVLLIPERTKRMLSLVTSSSFGSIKFT